ncbi:MAG: HAMP domain-containing sensor histidine kinase [Candidatus Sedimenticola sp. (ex Thyasira tokunagai)]
MFHTLYSRLSATLVVIFITIGITYGVITSSTIKSYLQELTQHFNRDLASRIVADRNLVEEGEINAAALKKTFSAYMDINPSIEIYLLDEGGRILSFSADPGRVKREHVDIAPIQAFLSGDDFPLLGDDPRSHDRKKAFSVTPVPSGDAPEGYLYVVLQGEEFDSAEQIVLESYALRFSAWVVAVSLGIGLLIGLLLFHLLTRRLQRLSQVMDTFRHSEFTQHIPYSSQGSHSHDEVALLGTAFDSMAERITVQLSELKDQDQLRRELVAQISHDLRTPLAALHGYLETLRMKGLQLETSTQQEYLEIALRQSTQLTSMVEDLFELAHLEARDLQPKFEPCAIAELLQDVAQKFRLHAEKSQVQLRMSPPATAPLITADIALTERLLDNLISNAIEHTPVGGLVDLSLTTGECTVSVTVTDSGSGIDEDDLPRLFEPFYQGKNRGGTSGHAGLGLAIAKRIAELQDGELTVQNSVKSGASFCFTLPLCL